MMYLCFCIITAILMTGGGLCQWIKPENDLWKTITRIVFLWDVHLKITNLNFGNLALYYLLQITFYIVNKRLLWCNVPTPPVTNYLLQILIWNVHYNKYAYLKTTLNLMFIMFIYLKRQRERDTERQRTSRMQRS